MQSGIFTRDYAKYPSLEPDRGKK